MTGLMGAAFLSLNQKSSGAGAENDFLVRQPKAKRIIHICLVGGFSQVDSFDYKPQLEKFHGSSLSGNEKPKTFFGNIGLLRKSEWKFKKRGKSGLWISDLFPYLSEVADDLTIINSMVADTANHMPAMFQENTGFQSNGFPSLGSWLSYGLGSISDSLPSFVVLPDARSLPNGGASNWSSGFLPAQYQGALFESGDQPIRNLFSKEQIAKSTEQEGLDFLRHLNQAHLNQRQELDILNARIRSYELAAKMQTSIPQVMNFSNEPEFIQRMYGVNQTHTSECARRCMLARRLLESGVRFVQMYSGGAFGGKPRHGWDGHENNQRNHSREARFIDQPVAALIKDLKQRGMLDDTLIICTSEFGRTPFTQSGANQLGLGRDHNPDGFSVWMAGAGIKKGISYGESDEIGWKAASNKVTWPDFHATILHVLGLDHKQLTWYHNGIERRLTNVHGHVINGLLS